ncbi:MAG: U32 family peptidase [Spirochaetaceae bacterium]|jgi:putative protease|nr:U32 family peptidase [Spirochaetaceae bacterium]
MSKIELLAPAGSPEALDAAIGEGADAVYLGLKNFNARMRTSNFAYSQFEGAVRSLHRMGKKIYVTVNTVFEQREGDRIFQFLKYLAAVGPDAIIVQDFGVACLVKEHFPSLKLHASTQMNIASAKGVNLLSKQGFSRVVLARELSLDEIRAIRQETNMALEVFVHGALCVSASGLCLFSSFLGGKSANRGMCTQACRRLYHQQAEKGYYFSPADLQLLENIPDLAGAGVNAFKIEGRMKSAGYVGTVVSAYRRVIDGLDGDREAALAGGLSKLKKDFAREKTTFYFYQNNPSAWLNAEQDGGTGISLGPLLKVTGSGDGRRGLLAARSGQEQDTVREQDAVIEEGDTIRLHRADDSDRVSHRVTYLREDASGGLWVSIPDGFEAGDSVYLISLKAGSRRYAQVLPRDLAPFRRQPGRDRAPPCDLAPSGGKGPFPEGLYAAVDAVEDLFVLQSRRPARVILGYSPKTASALLKKAGPSMRGAGSPLPFNPGEIIIDLDPYFPQSMDGDYARDIIPLVEAGYRAFIVNNPGHLACFRGLRVTLVAGPCLYTFNRWAQRFLSGLGLDYFVSPLENNRQNLEKTVAENRRRSVFVPVFAWPALFRIRSDLSSIYTFGNFEDNKGGGFELLTRGEGSIVIPGQPFSLVDKIPFLEASGFKRFILDFRYRQLRKKDYRDIMDALMNQRPLPNVSRFNWKDGFYSPDEALRV